MGRIRRQNTVFSKDDLLGLISSKKVLDAKTIDGFSAGEFMTKEEWYMWIKNLSMEGREYVSGAKVVYPVHGDIDVDDLFQIEVLPSGEYSNNKHRATSWYVFKDPGLTKLLDCSIEDVVNLTSWRPHMRGLQTGYLVVKIHHDLMNSWYSVPVRFKTKSDYTNISAPEPYIVKGSTSLNRTIVRIDGRSYGENPTIDPDNVDWVLSKKRLNGYYEVVRSELDSTQFKKYIDIWSGELKPNTEIRIKTRYQINGKKGPWGYVDFKIPYNAVSYKYKKLMNTPLIIQHIVPLGGDEFVFFTGETSLKRGPIDIERAGNVCSVFIYNAKTGDIRSLPNLPTAMQKDYGVGYHPRENRLYIVGGFSLQDSFYPNSIKPTKASRAVWYLELDRVLGRNHPYVNGKYGRTEDTAVYKHPSSMENEAQWKVFGQLYDTTSGKSPIVIEFTRRGVYNPATNKLYFIASHSWNYENNSTFDDGNKTYLIGINASGKSYTIDPFPTTYNSRRTAFTRLADGRALATTFHPRLPNSPNEAPSNTTTFVTSDPTDWEGSWVPAPARPGGPGFPATHGGYMDTTTEGLTLFIGDYNYGGRADFGVLTNYACQYDFVQDKWYLVSNIPLAGANSILAAGDDYFLIAQRTTSVFGFSNGNPGEFPHSEANTNIIKVSLCT